MTDLPALFQTYRIRGLSGPVVMYGCESWTVKKAKRQRIDAFELWCWRRLLRVPWTARRPNQSILKEISPGCSLEGLILKLKLQYFGHLMLDSEYAVKKTKRWDFYTLSKTECFLQGHWNGFMEHCPTSLNDKEMCKKKH